MGLPRIYYNIVENSKIWNLVKRSIFEIYQFEWKWTIDGQLEQKIWRDQIRLSEYERMYTDMKGCSKLMKCWHLDSDDAKDTRKLLVWCLKILNTVKSWPWLVWWFFCFLQPSGWCRAFEASAFPGFQERQRPPIPCISTGENNSIPRLSCCRNRLWRKAGKALIVESGSYKGKLRGLSRLPPWPSQGSTKSNFRV